MKFIIYILILLASIAVGVWLREDIGFIHIAYKDWTVETPIWLGIILLALLVFAILVILNITSAILTLPSAIKNYFLNRRNYQYIKNSQQALIYLLTDDYKAAYKYALRAHPTSSDFITARLIAACAANNLGSITDRNKHLLALKAQAPVLNNDLDVLMAKLELHNNNIKPAQNLLENLKRKNFNSYALYHTLANVYKTGNSWLQLKELLPILKKKNILTNPNYLLTIKLVYLELLKLYIQNNNQELPEQLWKEMPKHLRRDPEILYLFAKFLISNNKLEQADKELRDYLKNQVDNNLVKLFATINDNKLASRLYFLEKLLKDNPSNSYILFALGKVCINAKLFGRAKDYLLASLSINATKECYLELARLANIVNEPEYSITKYYKEGFLLNN